MKTLDVTAWKYRVIDEKERKQFALRILKEDQIKKGSKRATVPGSVFIDLERDGIIPDPFFANNEQRIQWVEDKDWLFTSSIDIPAEWRRLIQENPGDWRADLVFEGIDTFATIFANGKQLGTTDNCFIPWRFLLPGKYLLSEKKLRLAVFIESAKRRAEALQKKYGVMWSAFDTSRVYVRRPQYLTGWDWGPRLSGAALWRPVRLSLHRTCRISDVHVRTMKLPTRETNSATIEVSVELDIFSKRSSLFTHIIVRDSKDSLVATASKKISPAQRGVQSFSFKLEIPHAALWYPRGAGEQNLYDVHVSVSAGDVFLDEQTVACGIRTVELLQEPDEHGESFIFSVNGEKIFCKGYNWIPADIFPGRVTAEQYQKLLEGVVESNANCLRIWGGGIYENDLFYMLCDRMGIMVWQDFMFACSDYPQHESFLKQVQHEAENVVRRLRNHPCIIIWCGNNEIEWATAGRKIQLDTMPAVKIYTRILPTICTRLDGTRPYWRSSPFGGDDPNAEHLGDRHNWNVWSAWEPIEHYLKDRGRFLSEFGFQCLPDRRTVEGFAGPEYRSMSLADTPFMAHQKQDYLGNVRLLRYLLDYLVIPQRMDDIIYATQVMQAEALKTAVEHWRSLKFHTAGSLIWQFDDCWPVISWAVMDYYLRPKASWFYARRFFAPIIAGIERNGESLRCFVVNDSSESRHVDLALETRRFDGSQSGSFNQSLRLEANSPAERFEIKPSRLNLTSDTDEYIRLTVVDKETAEMVCNNVFFPSRLRLMSWKKPEIRIRNFMLTSDRTAQMTPSSNVYTKSVYVTCLHPDFLEISDNFFDLFEDTEKSISLRFTKDVSMEEVVNSLYFRCLNDLFITT